MHIGKILFVCSAAVFLLCCTAGEEVMFLIDNPFRQALLYENRGESIISQAFRSEGFSLRFVDVPLLIEDNTWSVESIENIGSPVAIFISPFLRNLITEVESVKSETTSIIYLGTNNQNRSEDYIWGVEAVPNLMDQDFIRYIETTTVPTYAMLDSRIIENYADLRSAFNEAMGSQPENSIQYFDTSPSLDTLQSLVQELVSLGTEQIINILRPRDTVNLVRALDSIPIGEISILSAGLPIASHNIGGFPIVYSEIIPQVLREWKTIRPAMEVQVDNTTESNTTINEAGESLKANIEVLLPFQSP